MNKKIIWGIAIVLVVILGVYFIKNQSTPSSVKIGLISGTTGDYAVVGENYNKGVELAKEQWEASHTVPVVTLFTENDEFNAKRGLSAYQKLASVDNVDAIVSMTTITVDVAYDLIHQSGKPFIQGFEQSKSAEKDNIFQLWPSGIPAEALLGAYVKEKGYKNVAVVVSQNIETWTNFANSFKKGYAGEVATVSVDSTSKDVRTDVLKLLALKPDAIVLYTVPQQAALIVKEAQKQSKTPLVFVFDQDIQTGEKEIKEVLGGFGALNGSIAMVTGGSNDAEDFVTAYKKKYTSEPGIGASTGYDSFNTLMNAYDPNMKKWLDNIQNTNASGASGEIKFDENGLRTAKVIIGPIVNGELPKGKFTQ
ncbi:MAG: ABC transporter substrate-binding protein [Patescibacteria group bacterium]